jgi:lipid A ethanolaminephosphotransferase
MESPLRRAFFWLPKRIVRLGIDRACLDGRSHDVWSHDNLFHSVLGLLQFRTSAYRADLDIVSGCRRR